ncbi:Hypothetical_protein [Hexamita inflata]|uniref:Hypothetical_protein n=1 Tax=Hexamita inflata TaxID=28002 RepID=A0AA86UCS2_9EUKA|nr:Hypothetical protein HINF_LOCUS34711 [Hexamita inflata]
MSNRVVNYFTESKKQSPCQIQSSITYQIKFNKSPTLKYTLQLKNYLPKQLSGKSSQKPPANLNSYNFRKTPLTRRCYGRPLVALHLIGVKYCFKISNKNTLQNKFITGLNLPVQTLTYTINILAYTTNITTDTAQHHIGVKNILSYILIQNNFQKYQYLILSNVISEFITFDHRVRRDKVISFLRLHRLSRNTNSLVFTNFSHLMKSHLYTASKIYLTFQKRYITNSCPNKKFLFLDSINLQKQIFLVTIQKWQK